MFRGAEPPALKLTAPTGAPGFLMKHCDWGEAEGMHLECFPSASVASPQGGGAAMQLGAGGPGPVVRLPSCYVLTIACGGVFDPSR